MIKWFVYIVFLLVFTPCLLLAKTKPGSKQLAIMPHTETALITTTFAELADTIKTVKKDQPKADLKVKEVAKAKKQPKPEKVDEQTGADAKKAKPKRQRRPDGMERPPEIPRRNDN
jgi:hypothetical protein